MYILRFPLFSFLCFHQDKLHVGRRNLWPRCDPILANVQSSLPSKQPLRLFRISWRVDAQNKPVCLRIALATSISLSSTNSRMTFSVTQQEAQLPTCSYKSINLPTGSLRVEMLLSTASQCPFLMSETNESTFSTVFNEICVSFFGKGELSESFTCYLECQERVGQVILLEKLCNQTDDTGVQLRGALMNTYSPASMSIGLLIKPLPNDGEGEETCAQK